MKKYTAAALRGASIVTFALLYTVQSAHAQDATPAPSDGVQDIVVTAQRKAESLQNTPISIMALGQGALANKAITGMSDLTAQVPNLQLTPFPGNATSQRVYIRGIGSNNDQLTQDPSVAVYVDGVYVARSQGLATEVADLERIEVLRGPQGSLYGRNATGGAINFITVAPRLGEWSAKQSFTVGNLDAFRSRTQVNIPVGDTIAAQFSYYHAQRDGVTKNLGTGVDRFGDQDRNAYRAALLWKPLADLELRYTYDRTEIGDTPVFAAPVPFYPVVPAQPKQGSRYVRNLQPNDVVSQGHSLIASWDVAPSLQIKSITAWRKLSSFTNQDYLSGVYGPFAASFVKFYQAQTQFSEELQFVGKLGDSLDYAAGLYYFTETARGYDTAYQMASQLIERRITTNNKAYAVYAQATYTPDVLDHRLHLTAGGRWSRDERRATFLRAVTVGNNPTVTQPPGVGDRNFENFSPSGTLAFEIDRNVNSYFRVSTGYKTGGYNVGASSLQRFADGFGPEKVTSYEFGVKSELLNRTLRVNAAAFSMNYRDIQVNLPDPGQPSLIDVINAGRGQIRGVELDITMRPSRRLSVGVNYAYLDARYTRILDAAGNDVTGRYAYVSAPKNALSLNLDYEFPETSIGVPSLHVDYGFQSKQFAQANDPRYIIGDYGLLNARFNLSEIHTPIGTWQLGLWSKNLTDKSYYVTHANLFAPGAIYGDPRTYGIDLTIAF